MDFCVWWMVVCGGISGSSDGEKGMVGEECMETSLALGFYVW